MIIIENINIPLINIVFKQEENKIPLCILYTKEKILNKEINIFIDNMAYFKGFYLTRKENINNVYEYTFIAFNQEIYLEFYKEFFEKHKNAIITNNLIDYIDGFLYINPISHQIMINNLSENNGQIYCFYILKENIIHVNYEIISSIKDINVIMKYPLIEINFNNLIMTEDVDFIQNLSKDHNQQNLKNVKKITEMKTKEGFKKFLIEMPLKLNTQKVLEYSYIYNNKKSLIPTIENYGHIKYMNTRMKNISINYDDIKIKPQKVFEIIENIAYKAFIYNNPLKNISINIKINDSNKNIIFSIKLYDFFKKGGDFYKITYIEIIYNNNEKICRIIGKLFLNIENQRIRNFSNENNQILEKNIEDYYLKLDEVFYFNNDTILKNIYLYKEYKNGKIYNILS
jgi:hypothetical protein